MVVEWLLNGFCLVVVWLLYGCHPAQIDFLAFIIDIRGSGIGREVKVRYWRYQHEYDAYAFDDEWILERSWRLELFSRYDEDNEIDIVP